jgi:hypothetical protein
MAAGSNSHNDAARVMSENTIAISPSGGRTPSGPAAAPPDDADPPVPVKVSRACQSGMYNRIISEV